MPQVFLPLINPRRIKMQIRAGVISMMLLASIQVIAIPLKSPNIYETQISLELKNESLINAFKKIEAESPFYFMYRYDDVKNIINLNIPRSKQTIADFLKLILANTSLIFKQVDQRILINYKNPQTVAGQPKQTSFNQKPEQTGFYQESADIVADHVVGGIITNENGEPIEGVSVSLKGSSVATLTNAEGKYKISVPQGGVLVFSYVGFEAQEVLIKNQTDINLALQQKTANLNEVVVTALGLKRQTKSLTYSTQTVSPKELTEAREINVLSSLEGKVAGLAVTSSGSGVGADVRLVLRGNRSIDGDSQPLYVIDGVIGANPTDISPDNIASLNVLKGANASALYGSAAQNGVILIETKKGSSGSHLSLNQTFMQQDPYKLLPFQNVYGQGYAGVYSSNADASWGPKMEGQMVKTWSQDPADSGKMYAFLPQPDNRMDVFQKGYNMATNVTASLGSENIQAFMSYTFTDGQGILPNNTLLRHNFSTRINGKISSRLSFDSKIEFTQQQLKNKGQTFDNPTSQNYPDAIEQIYNMPANIRTQDLLHYSFKDVNGNTVQNYWNPSSVNGDNVYWVLNEIQDIATIRRSVIMTSFTYSFSDALKLMARGSYNGYNSTESYENHNGTLPNGFGAYSESQGQGLVLNGDFLLSYAHDIGKNWNVKVSAGGSTAEFRNSSVSANTGRALLVPNFFAMSNTSAPNAGFDPGQSSNINSLYAFSTISWKNGLFFDITGRNDWSSTLPENNRSYFYPSVGMSAVLSDLIPSFPKSISFAKLRMSYAIVGNATKPYALQRDAYFNAGGYNGFLQLSSVLPNPNLFPEKTNSLEMGLDLRFLENRLGVDVTLYKTETKDQIFQLALPVGSGAASYFTNGGDVQNKGIEIVLTATPVRTTNFNWDVTVNFAKNKNTVVKISDESPKIIIPESYFKDFVIEQGAPYGQIYGKGYQRDANGSVIVGSDGLPLITDGRSVLLANFSPLWTGGIINSFTYKNFSLSFVIETRQGGTMVSQSNAIIDGLGLSERTTQGRDGGLIFGQNFFGNEKAVLEDGKPNNIAITAEKFWEFVGGRNSPVAEPFVVSATNTRLRELVIGYSFPRSVVNKLHFADIKISLVGRNLFFIYRASQYADPDIMLTTDKTSEGYQYFNPPSSRYYGVNLKIGFK